MRLSFYNAMEKAKIQLDKEEKNTGVRPILVIHDWPTTPELVEPNQHKCWELEKNGHWHT